MRDTNCHGLEYRGQNEHFRGGDILYGLLLWVREKLILKAVTA